MRYSTHNIYNIIDQRRFQIRLHYAAYPRMWAPGGSQELTSKAEIWPNWRAQTDSMSITSTTAKLAIRNLIEYLQQLSNVHAQAADVDRKMFFKYLVRTSGRSDCKQDLPPIVLNKRLYNNFIWWSWKFLSLLTLWRAVQKCRIKLSLTDIEKIYSKRITQASATINFLIDHNKISGTEYICIFSTRSALTKWQIV